MSDTYTPKKAVIYARYSSHNQREESIEGQIRECTKFATANNIMIVGEYCDRAISGKTDNRAAFQRMMKDSERGIFDTVIMYTLDRFARNRYDSATYKAKLKRNGVRVLYAKQSIPDGPEGIILESVLEGYAEYYSENLSRNVKRGMKENALQCKTNGGNIPLGYRRGSDDRYEIDPAAAPIVREIFDLYANGKSVTQIIKILNDKGYRTAAGREFKKTSLQTILYNKKYIGVYEFDDVVIEGGVPAIVDRELFDKVQYMLKKNKRATGRMKAHANYLLSTKLFCGECGSTMVGESGTGKQGVIYNYYKCSGRKNHRGCNKHTEQKEWIENLVVRETINRILVPDVIEEIATKAAQILEDEYNDKSHLQALEADLKKTQSAINNIIKLVEKGVSNDDIETRLIELSSYKQDLLAQISREQMKKPIMSAEKIAYWLEGFLSTGDVDDVEYQQRIIDTLVNSVYIFDDPDGGRKVVITYNTTNKLTSTVKLSDIKGYALP